MKAQAAAEFLLSFAIFLAVLSLLVAGVEGMASAEEEFGEYVEARVLAERMASAADSACLAPGLAGAAEAGYVPVSGGIIPEGKGAAAGIVSCGVDIDGEPV